MTYTSIIDMLKQANFVTAHPILTGLGAGSIAGIATQTGGNLLDRHAEQKQSEPIELNPVKADKQTNINTGLAALGGGAAAAGIYSAFGAIPAFKRRKILRAVMAILGGGAVGYAAWNASNNYQNNTKRS